MNDENMEQGTENFAYQLRKTAETQRTNELNEFVRVALISIKQAAKDAASIGRMRTHYISPPIRGYLKESSSEIESRIKAVISQAGFKKAEMTWNNYGTTLYVDCEW